MNDLQKRFSEKSNLDLYRIVLVNSEDYRTEAIVFAREELESRSLTKEEVNDFQRILSEEKNTANEKIIEEKSKNDLVVSKFKYWLLKDNTSADKFAFAIIIGVLVIFFESSWNGLYWFFYDVIFYPEFFNAFNLLNLLQPILLVLGLILFHRRKKLGWHLLLFLTFWLISNEFLFVINVQINPTVFGFEEGTSGQALLYLIDFYFIVVVVVFLMLLMNSIGNLFRLSKLRYLTLLFIPLFGILSFLFWKIFD